MGVIKINKKAEIERLFYDEHLRPTDIVKKKNEIVIINRFKENSADSITTTLTVFVK